MFIDRTALVAEKLGELGLNPGHLIVVTEVNPSRHLPYHNSHHCLSVGLNALEGARVAGLGLEAQRSLFIAGLYHDFNHSGGAKDDNANVADAAAHMIAWCRLLEDFSDSQIESIRRAISSTCWPPENYTGERTLAENILCDADMLQWTEEDTEEFMRGLGIEKGIIVNWEDTRIFLKEHWPRTQWAQDRVAKWLEEHGHRS